MEEQKRQAQLLDDTAKLVASIKSTADTVGVQNKAQVAAFESAAQSKMAQIGTAIKDTQTQLQNSQTSVNEQIALLASAHAANAMQTNEGLNANGLQIQSLASDTQRSHALFMKLLIAGLVASAAMIGLAVAILQRH
jgi:hypothetical protein